MKTAHYTINLSKPGNNAIIKALLISGFIAMIIIWKAIFYLSLLVAVPLFILTAVTNLKLFLEKANSSKLMFTISSKKLWRS
jgi:hypothetical protein